MSTAIPWVIKMLDGDNFDLILYGLVALAITAVAMAILYPLMMQENVTDRIQVATTSVSKKVAARSAAEVTANRKKAVTETLKEIDTRKKKLEKASLRTRLQQAGLQADAKAYYIASAICGVVVAIVTYFSLPLSLANIGGGLAVVSGLVGAFGLPGWILNYLIKRRQAKFTAHLANAIDVVVRGVKTGLPLNECLGIISRESPEPIASEFREVVNQQRMGVTLAEALDRLVARMPLPEVKFLAIVISIQASAGGNLSEALGNLSQVLRDRFGMKLKVKALSSEALASAGVLGSLPPIMVIMIRIVSPDYLIPLWSTQTGNFALIFGMVWMSCGIFVMRKMINFKY
jgi:tight adherence protein B